MQSTETHPAGPGSTVCCIMLTLPSRIDYARKSIESYCSQTLRRKRLLLIADHGKDEAYQPLRDHVTSLGRDDIRIEIAPPGVNLGQLRNFSLDVADADVVCQWDDDDLYHPERLARQLAALEEGDFEAVYLQEVIQYFPADATMYWTNWRAVPVKAHPGTLMMRRGVPVRYPVEGQQAHLGEDTVVGLALMERGRVGYLAGMPHLFVYVSHGSNSWDNEHHRMLARELAISQALLRRREAQIREGLAPYAFRPNRISFVGNNGPGFVL